MDLSYEDRAYVKLEVRHRLAELSGSGFERFFQSVMSARYADFLDIRTHGNLGDLGADGLALHGAKLYACYAPQVPTVKAVRGKLLSDLEKAIRKRAGQFETFVFVHNDLRGVHPEISHMLQTARREHPELKFEQMGPQHLLREIYQLPRDAIEDLIGAAIPVRDRVYSISMDDLEPLLAHLVKQRRRVGSSMPAREVPPDKLDYNRLDADDQRDLIDAMRFTPQVDEYYQQRRDITERDEVACGFSAYYQQVKERYDEPGDVLWKLQEYVAGNARGSRDQERAVMVVLAYFFETCDIFEEPPSGWRVGTMREAP